ncbi:RepA protein [Escherichia coli]|uniref:helix-turn-helix domain-containing protein n=1 Tax=Escherichia coli TaxID=562 RepID=UPI0006A4756D|nr:helix-turn-helix domain-containing protein [Escherichia coli]CTY43040.1 RepA protein [Escherichia coli]CTZ44726.1 RepA protein [Escherichia coli]CUA54982.1 RepA protein [Escherichia coli]
MYLGSERVKDNRIRELHREAQDAIERREDERKNSMFTQTYPKGWKRIRELSRDKQGVSSIALYSFLAENIDSTCGAVVADQQFLADQLGVSRSTIKRWLNYLESKGALVKIPVAGKVCAYALDPHEVWKGYNTSKNYAAFVTKTLVNKDGDIQRRIMAMFSGEKSGQEQKRSDS